MATIIYVSFRTTKTLTYINVDLLVMLPRATSIVFVLRMLTVKGMVQSSPP